MENHVFLAEVNVLNGMFAYSTCRLSHHTSSHGPYQKWESCLGGEYGQGAQRPGRARQRGCHVMKGRGDADVTSLGMKFSRMPSTPSISPVTTFFLLNEQR